MRFLRVYSRVLGLLATEKRVAWMLAVANVALAGLYFFEPVLFGRVVDLLARSAQMEPAKVWSEAGALLGLWVAVGLGGIGANIAVALQADRMAHRNRLAAMSRYFQHVLSMPLSFHGEVHSGRLLKVMLSGADHLFGLWLSFFREHLSTFVTALVLLPLTLLMNWRLALTLIVLVVVFCIATVFVIRRTEAAQRAVEEYHSELAGTAQDALANVMVVQAFTRLNAEARLFGDIVKHVLDHQFPVLNWWAVVSVLTRAASTIGVIAIFVVGTMLHIQGQASVGEIVSFMGFANLLIGKLEAATGFASRLFFQLPSLEEFFGVLDAKSSVPERVGARDMGHAKGEVVFDQVCFAYPNTENILTDVSFSAKPGMSIALVGHTGAGKSTAMALLQRLWDATSGSIQIDGQDVRDVPLDSLRRNIGVVFQESLLFNRSIADNLAVGRADATMADIERACQLAQAADFIKHQPKGYDTRVGERGSTLSGGQRQRLAIARALVKDPPILILDEATSALDAATEAKVQVALKNLMRGRTTFIIAHRLSTVRDADEILVFEAGRIVERGSFDALVAQGGKFAELVATQLAVPTPTPTPTPEGQPKAAADTPLSD